MASITSTSPPVNAIPPADTPPRSHARHRLDPESLAFRRREVAANCSWNRDARRILALADKLARLLEKFAALDARRCIVEAWRAEGLPRARDDDDETGQLLDLADHLADEAGGFGWALSHFVSVFECQTTASDHERSGGHR